MARGVVVLDTNVLVSALLNPFGNPLPRRLMAVPATATTHAQYITTRIWLAHPTNPITPGGRTFGA